MLRKKILLCSLLSAVSLFSKIDFPTIVEIDQYTVPLSRYSSHVDPRAWTLGRLAFYQSPELIPFFAYLRDEYRIQAACETGTWKGESTALFALLFNQVHTFEVLESHYQIAKDNLQQFNNVICHFGSSSEGLRQVLPQISEKRTLFYLDAHWQSYWPLLDELEEISKTHKDNCIVVVDDIKVPNRPDIEFDSYNDQECSYEYVKEKLDKIFTEYSIHYLIPRHVCARAKLIVIPKNFK